MISNPFVKTKSFEGVQLLKTGISYFGHAPKPVYCYIVDDHLIDTGPSLARKKLTAIFQDLPIEKIILTHTHEDHSGNAAFLKNILNVQVYGHQKAVDIMAEGFSILPYQKLMFGPADVLKMEVLDNQLQTENYSFDVYHTPGHAPEHIVLHEPTKGWLFAGDLYVGERIKYFRKGESLRQQIKSLKQIVALDFDTVFCGHNPVLQAGKSRIKNKLKYFEELESSIHHYYGKGYSIEEIMKRTGIKNERNVSMITFGDVKSEYLVRSVIENW